MGFDASLVLKAIRGPHPDELVRAVAAIYVREGFMVGPSRFLFMNLAVAVNYKYWIKSPMLRSPMNVFLTVLDLAPQVCA
jgi:hypothetical protein